MTKVLIFEVSIKNLENKIWRKIEITDRRTIADLTYTILASFDSLAYHLYHIKYENVIYDCGCFIEDASSELSSINSIVTKLSSIGLKDNDIMEMNYDTGSTTTFKIKYLGAKDLEKGKGNHYPYIVDGAGRGMIDDLCDFELKSIIEDIDLKGYSEHYFTSGYQRTIKYDYREYNIKNDNVLLKGLVLEIKNKYEVGD